MPEKRRTRPCPSHSQSAAAVCLSPNPTDDSRPFRPHGNGRQGGRRRSGTAPDGTGGGQPRPAAGGGYRGLSPKRLLGRKAHRDLFLSDGAGLRSRGIKKPISSSAVSPCRDKPNTPAFIRAFALRFFSLRAPYLCGKMASRLAESVPYGTARSAEPLGKRPLLPAPIPTPQETAPSHSDKSASETENAASAKAALAAKCLTAVLRAARTPVLAPASGRPAAAALSAFLFR